MQTPTIVKQTKDYMLIKVPLPKGVGLGYPALPKKSVMTAAERELWDIIQEGEQEYREGKTIRAESIDEAIKLYDRQKNR